MAVAPRRALVPLAYVAVVAAAAVLVVALLFPHLRKSIALIGAGLALAWIRHRFFRIDGITGVPFGRTSRLFRGRRATRVKAE